MYILSILFLYLITTITKFLTAVVVFAAHLKATYRLYTIQFLEGKYQKGQNSTTRTALENQKLRLKLAKETAARKNATQSLNGLSNKQSCLYFRWKTIMLKLSFGLSPQEIEELSGFTYRSISQ